MELYPGAVVAGRYRVDEKIGAGGMGEVWAGEHVAIGTRIAVKTLPPAMALDRQLVARFRREAQLLGRLRSERVARVIDFLDDPYFGFVLVMDFVEGEPLGTVLGTRRLGVEEAIEVGIDIASALCDLHRAKVVHRDLKPDNVILEPLPGGRRRAVIVDLGVSRIDASSSGDDAVTSITETDMAVGTLTYMAPEQLLSSSTATAAADVYALGAILYRAISGEPVFGEEDESVAAKRKLNSEAPALSVPRIDRVGMGLSAVVARALQRDPERRFASAEEMLRELLMLADLARLTALDLDAPTEHAPTEHAPTQHAPPGILASSTDPDTIEDLPTQQSPTSQPASQRLAPSADVVFSSSPATPHASSSNPSDPLTSSRQTRTTVHSPVQAPTKKTLTSVVDIPVAPPAPTPASPPERMVPLRSAWLGMVAALALGALLGYGAHATSIRSQPRPPIVTQP
jgi:serine/threonine-protein kinase